MIPYCPCFGTAVRGIIHVLKSMYFVYLLRCKDGSLYCGSTNNLKKREIRHNTGLGSRYVRSRGGGSMVYSERFKDLAHALRREMEIKRYSKQKKEQLVNAA